MIYDGIKPPPKSIVKSIKKVIAFLPMNSCLDNGYAASAIINVDKTHVATDTIIVVLYEYITWVGFLNICWYAVKSSSFGKNKYPYSLIVSLPVNDVDIIRQRGITKQSEIANKTKLRTIWYNVFDFLFDFIFFAPFLKHCTVWI